jgi:putative cardiolipin synthase
MDLTGRYFVQELLLAADRGVRVRILVDDMDARKENATFAALSAHPSIEVRTFNPFASRTGAMRFIAEATTSFERINRRMHNKSWIADNRLAIVGGRNIGDEYFGASDEKNFVDLDFAMIGPVVREASASFDRYWNAPATYPIETLDPAAVTTDALNKLRDELRTHAAQAEQSRYAQALRTDDAIKRMVAGEWPMQWSDKFQFVSDNPLKVTMKERDAQTTHVGAALVPLVTGAQTRLSIISPYFVPGDEVTSRFGSMVKSGTQVRILTNSLAANDVAAVHGGYSRHRKDLLEGGVQLWELKP